MFKIIRRRDGKRTRGQALVEFALVLPLLALLLLMAVDFGRVFFGWVALQNAARIGADYAAAHADAWAVPKPSEQGDFRLRVVADMQAINCQPVGGGTWDATDVPDPIFAGYEDGDAVSLGLTCSFGLLTPLAEGLFGGPVTVHAQSEFTVTRTIFLGVPGAPPPPPPVVCDPGQSLVPNMVGNTVANARAAWSDAGFTGSFLPGTGHNGQQVLTQVTTPGSSPGDCIASTASVTVTY